MRNIKTIIISSIILISNLGGQTVHPNLVLTSSDVIEIKKSIGTVPLFDKSFNEAKEKVDLAIESPMEIPYPKDAGGGYTHERHKQNYDEMYLSGILYQITKEEKYAQFVKKMLDAYAVLYPTLGRHPQGKKQVPGKLFWQTLNETVWLLHTIQAYDAIFDWLSKADRKNYEDNIFNPMANFFINDCSHSFNLVHNHGTWMVAAVGMTGFVLNNEEYINKAIYGSNKDGESGYLAQLNGLFSPDGYYTEGGYYVRYALWPFFIFAESIHNNLPNLKIYDYRDNILEKALYSAFQVTDSQGAFIPVNDAIKAKNWLSKELIFATNFVYARYKKDRQLLYLVNLHDEVSLSGAGLLAAKDMMKNEPIPIFNRKSVEYTDGPNGDWGGIGILRFGDASDQETLFMKYGSHGLSHGHFDKLSFIFYDNGQEIIRDYGAARFVNIEEKFGGRYLDENDSFAKQTIAHNTVVVDGKSQFDGDKDLSQEHHSEKYLFNIGDSDFQYVSAKESNAYPGVEMHRTMMLVNDEKIMKPILVDVFKIKSTNNHLYDLPFYYSGQFITSNFKYLASTKTKSILGEKHGYQHLWKDAEATVKSISQFTWLQNSRFYTITSNTENGDKIYLAQIGANDPDFNLRNENALIIQKKGSDKTFVNIIEPHGAVNPIYESTIGSKSSFENLRLIYDDENYTIVEIKGINKIDWKIMISNNNNDGKAIHSLSANNENYNWIGPVSIKK